MATINSWNNDIEVAGTTINAGNTGSINIGSDGHDDQINIGTAASTGRNIIIGNNTGTTQTTI